jgi:sialate O-acetylesterase
MKVPFELSSMFTDHMVLQQKTQVPIWGTGPDGVEAYVQFQGQTVITTIRNGSWMFYLQPLQPGGPYEMKV